VGDLFLALSGLGMGITLALVITGEDSGSLRAPGGLLIATGRLAGFTGAYLTLVMRPGKVRTASRDTAVAVAGEEGLALAEAVDGYEAMVVKLDGAMRWAAGFPLETI
jgi:hypothetical protein